LFINRFIDGKEAERIGLVSLAVPGDRLEESVNKIAAEIAATSLLGIFHGKEFFNTHLEILGLGALFRYHGQMNALGRLKKLE